VSLLFGRKKKQKSVGTKIYFSFFSELCGTLKIWYLTILLLLYIYLCSYVP